MTPSENLQAAAKLLRHDGWCQFDAAKRDGSRCLLSAIVETAPDRETESAALKLMRSRLWDKASTLSAVRWNDHHERTVDDVLALLEGRAAG